MRPLHQIETYSVWILQLTWTLKAGTGFQALSLSAGVFVCELSICLEIDQSPRFTRRVMSFETVFFVPVWTGGSILSSLSTFLVTCSFILRDCTDLVPTLYHCTLKTLHGEVQGHPASSGRDLMVFSKWPVLRISHLCHCHCFSMKYHVAGKFSCDVLSCQCHGFGFLIFFRTHVLPVENISAVCAELFRCLEVLFQSSCNVNHARKVHDTSLRNIISTLTSARHAVYCILARALFA